MEPVLGIRDGALGWYSGGCVLRGLRMRLNARSSPYDVAGGMLMMVGGVRR